MITCCSWMRSPFVGGRPGLQVELQHHPMPRELGPDERERLVDDVVEIEGKLPRLFFSEHRLDPPDHVIGALALRDHARHRQPDLVQIRRVAIEPPEAGFAIGHDRRQRLLHLMGDRGGELAQGDDPCHMGERRLGLLQGFLGEPGGGDIHLGPDDLGPAGPVLEDAADEAEMLRRAVRHQQAEVEIEPGLRFRIRPRDRSEALFDHRHILGMYALEGGFQRRRHAPVELIDSIELLRPQELAGRDLPAEASGMAQSLGEIEQIGMLAQPRCGRQDPQGKQRGDDDRQEAHQASAKRRVERPARHGTGCS